MEGKSFLERVRTLPDWEKHTIVWIGTIIAGGVLIFWMVERIGGRLTSLELSIPQLKNVPTISFPVNQLEMKSDTESVSPSPLEPTPSPRDSKSVSEY